MNIPGLLHTPASTSGAASGLEDIQITTFSMKTFTVPGAHRYGNCRPVTDFTRICTIGSSTNGTLYKVKDNKSNDIAALKKLKVSADDTMPQSCLREITHLKQLKHLNIVNLHGTAVGKNIESTYLILDYCDYALSRVIDQVPTAYLGEPQIKNIMGQLFTGLDYIHKQGVFHRDLSPSNVLFTESGVLKITDFGLSRKATGDLTPSPGMRWYKAPEVVFGATRYNSAVDMWAAGCIFGEMLGQKVLFRGDTDADVIKLMIHLLGTPTERSWPGFSELPVPKNYYLKRQPYNRIRSTFVKESLNIISVLHKLLAYNPPSRLTAEQCLKQPYFSELPPACSVEELRRTLQASSRL